MMYSGNEQRRCAGNTDICNDDECIYWWYQSESCGGNEWTSDQAAEYGRCNGFDLPVLQIKIEKKR